MCKKWPGCCLWVQKLFKILTKRALLKCILKARYSNPVKNYLHPNAYTFTSRHTYNSTEISTSFVFEAWLVWLCSVALVLRTFFAFGVDVPTLVQVSASVHSSLHFIPFYYNFEFSVFPKFHLYSFSILFFFILSNSQGWPMKLVQSRHIHTFSVQFQYFMNVWLISHYIVGFSFGWCNHALSPVCSVEQI